MCSPSTALCGLPFSPAQAHRVCVCLRVCACVCPGIAPALAHRAQLGSAPLLLHCHTVHTWGLLVVAPLEIQALEDEGASLQTSQAAGTSHQLANSIKKQGLHLGPRSHMRVRQALHRVSAWAHKALMSHERRIDSCAEKQRTHDGEVLCALTA